MNEAVIIAGEQSEGRGRMGRRFESPKGGLYLSVLTSRIPAGEGALALPPAAALAVRAAVEKCFGLSCSIKHPNDLLLGGRKISGILCESFSAGERFCAVIGCGINVLTRIPEDSVRGTGGQFSVPPGALCEFSEAASEADALAKLEAAVLRELMALIDAFAAGGGLNEAAYRRYCVNCPDRIVQY